MAARRIVKVESILDNRNVLQNLFGTQRIDVFVPGDTANIWSATLEQVRDFIVANVPDSQFRMEVSSTNQGAGRSEAPWPNPIRYWRISADGGARWTAWIPTGSEANTHIGVSVVSTLPSDPFNGQLVFDTSDNRFKVWDATASEWRSEAISVGPAPEPVIDGGAIPGTIPGTITIETEGSDVTANPDGDPTETLRTIEIDGVIYRIEGGGSGGQTIDTQLYYGFAATATPDLSELTNRHVTNTIQHVTDSTTDTDQYFVLMLPVAHTIAILRNPLGANVINTYTETTVAISGTIYRRYSRGPLVPLSYNYQLTIG